MSESRLSPCAADLVYDEPALGHTVHGPDAIREFVTRMARAYPDYSFTRMGLYTEVTRRAVLVAWRFTGTFAKTGNRVEFHGDDRLELGEDGLIHAYRCLYDNQFAVNGLAGRDRPADGCGRVAGADVLRHRPRPDGVDGAGAARPAGRHGVERVDPRSRRPGREFLKCRRSVGHARSP